MAEAAQKFTKYEKARMIGARALQIAMGAPFLVELDEKKLEGIRYNPVEIAKMEYEAGIIPLDVLRKVPEFVEDFSKHPIAAKGEGAEEVSEVEDVKISEEEEEDVESSEEEAPGEESLE